MSPNDPHKTGLAMQIWRSRGLIFGIATIVFVVSYSIYSSRSDRLQQSGRLSSLNIEVMLQARRIFHRQSDVDGKSDILPQRTEFLHNLSEIARLDPTPLSIRKLALGQFLVNDREWRMTLVRLRSLPQQSTARSIEEELNTWNAILERGTSRANIPTILSKIDSWKLGWFAHLARVNLYRQSGLPNALEVEMQSANQSVRMLSLIIQIRIISGIAGVFLALVYGRKYWKKHVSKGQTDDPATSTMVSDIVQSASSGLINLFVAYLLIYLLSRMIFRWIIVSALPLLGLPMSTSTALMANFLVSLLPMLIIGYHLKTCTPAGNSLLGLIPNTWKSLAQDILAGIVCFCISVPLLTAASIVSTMIFRGTYSPINPAISQYTNSDSIHIQMLLFIMAAGLAPVVEEFMFRGALMTGLMHQSGVARGLIYSSAIFAVLHPQIPHGLIPIFALGFCFGSVAYVRKSIVPAIVAHSLNNGLIFMMLASVMHE